MVWWNIKPVDRKIKENRDRYFSGLGIDPSRVVAGGIEHGTTISVVGEESAGEYILNSDALITDRPNIILTVTAADCVPVFFLDAKGKRIGIAHAGWRGLTAGLLEKVVLEMKRVYGSDPIDLDVSIGPCIGPCHYEVGQDVYGKLDVCSVVRRGDKVFAALAREAAKRLVSTGVSRIRVSEECTYCLKDKYYSARRDKVSPREGMVAFIGIINA